LEKTSAAAAKAIRGALDLASNAYPGLKRGAPTDTAKFLAAASTARIATTNLR
jgi:hypothetical protein